MNNNKKQEMLNITNNIDILGFKIIYEICNILNKTKGL